MRLENSKTTIEDYNLTDDGTMLGHTLERLFEQAVQRHEDRTAVISAGTELKYSELNKLANQFAHFMVAQGIKRGDLVGVALDRSVMLITVLLAVVKTGATYVPIDPAFPADRIKHTLEDAAPKLLVVSSITLGLLPSWAGNYVNIDSDWRQKMDDLHDHNLDLNISPVDLAYVIYTSGSTGRPKGVEIPHGALSNTLLAMQRTIGCNHTDRLLAMTTIAFDMAVPDMFLPLICGASIVLAQQDESKNVSILFTLMRRHTITLMQGTPSTWQMLLDYGWQDDVYSPAKILCGGEALSRQLADRLLALCGDRGVVWNMYGPTEATVWASGWKVQPGDGLWIGKPLNNYQLYVLDESLAPVSLGEIGELYIGGSGLARGYHNDADLTQSRFLKNPFHPGRMYRTGDLARWSAPEKLSVVGRADSQVKVRGYRVELSDIESTIAACEGISKCVVVSRDERLVAYCQRCVPGENAGVMAMLADQLRPWIAERLPPYMMPAFFVELDVFPLSPNGKVDQKALPDPITALHRPVPATPVTELERLIFQVWSRVLGHTQFGVTDNFFEVGGDSLRLVRIQAELEKLLRRPILVAKLFQHYTIKALATYLASMTGASPVQKPISSPQHHPPHEEDIAIVSTACRLPGGITTPEEYWELLVEGGEVITPVPKSRWNAEELYSSDWSSPGKSYCRQGGFLPDIQSFDASFFGISPREARKLHPTQYWMLEACWESFERAGYTLEQLRGSQTGVYIGTSHIPAHQEPVHGPIDLDGYAGTGSASSTISGRISYVMGLEGPTITIDTACSSSLVATHLACTALRQGECDMAVAGGVSLMLTPGLHVEFSRLRGMSTDGRCRAFSTDADGTGWSDGVAAVVLKRVSDAQRDGDTIHALLRSTVVNHGGRSASLTTPSGSAQERLIRSALAKAGLSTGDIDYIEAHGTATTLGDPIEGSAIAEVFSESRRSGEMQPLWIGSAKSNVGHTQAAAGLVGLLKVILALRHNTLPQTLYSENPTALIPWQKANIALVQQNQPWLPREDHPRRAGVSAFGIGGTNAHAIVEEAPRGMTKVGSQSTNLLKNSSLPLLPFVLSGQTAAALSQQAHKLRDHQKKRLGHLTESGGDLAYSLAVSRNHFSQRLVLLAHGELDLLEKLTSMPTDAVRTPDGHKEVKPRLAMLFTGQGSQWLGMGRALAHQFSAFREALHEVSSHFTPTLEKPLLDVMWAAEGSADAALLQRTDYAQPALFSLEVALWRLWDSWGVRPEFVLGHSLGELAAAHVAGVMHLPDACRLVTARSQLMHERLGQGNMVSIEARAADIVAAMEMLGVSDKVDVASVNAPALTVISGDLDAVDTVSAHFSSHGRKTKNLAASHAFHSHHVDGIVADLLTVAQTVTFHPPRLPVVSGLTGELVPVGQLQAAAYWVDQARRPVLFSDGIHTLLGLGINAFLEIGPRPVLCSMSSMCIDDANQAALPLYLPSLDSRRDGTELIHASLAKLHVRHWPIDWTGYFEPTGYRRVDLPTYAFQRECFTTTRDKEAVNSSIHPIREADQRKFQWENCRFGIQWRRVEAADSPPCAASWGILSHTSKSARANEIISALSAAGVKLREVSSLQDTQSLDGLLCFWQSDADILAQTRELTAKALAQLQEAGENTIAVPLVWVTWNAVGTGADDQLDGLGASPLWGLMRTARNEYPELLLRLVDLGGENADVHAFASCLMMPTEDECAIRRGQVLVPRMERIEPTPHKIGNIRPDLLRCDGAVLITGGTGGIGQSVGRWLVTTLGIRDLVLTSRRGMDAPGAQELIQELLNLGAKATVAACDVADFESISNLMALFGGKRPLRGVVHAAGLLDDGVLSAMTPMRCDTVFKSKIDGVWNLHQLTRNMDLDLFVMFSSISGVMGTAGQANYAAANTFLDALSYLRRTEGLPATSIAWGLWGDKGMGANMTETGRLRYAQAGLHPLGLEAGLRLLDQALRDGNALTVAAAYDLDQLQAHVDNRKQRSSLLLSLLGSKTEGKEQLSVHEDSGGNSAFSKKLKTARLEEHAAIALELVRATVATALGFASPRDINVHRPLQEIGIDSLTAVLIRGQLSKVTGLVLSPRIVFDYPDLTALSHFLLSRVQDSWESSSPESGSDYSTAPSDVEPDGPVLNMPAIRQGCLDSEFKFDCSPQLPAATRPKSVFITGATGFVGAFILQKLLELGIETHCLVRAVSVKGAMGRLVATLSAYNLWKPHYITLVVPVVGDMGKPMLGLDPETFEQLAGQIDSICHSGALVDWMRPLEDYVKSNLVSTHEILRLASTGRVKPVHLISTVSTLSKYAGNEIPEDDREYGYATSKWIAEQMVAAARWRGATASIYRLPFVMASTATGHFRKDRGDFLHNLIAGSIEMGWFPALEADLSALLPVDYLASTIATIMTQDQARIGHDFDFLNDGAPSLNRFFAWMGAASGGMQDLLPFSEWRRRALAYAIAHPTSSLARIAAVIDMLTEDGATAMMKPSPVGKHIFGGAVYPVPPVNPEFAHRYSERIAA